MNPDAMSCADLLDASIAASLEQLPRRGRVLFRLGLWYIGRLGDRMPVETLAARLAEITPPKTPADTIAVLALSRCAMKRWPDSWTEIVPPPPADWLEQHGVEP